VKRTPGVWGPLARRKRRFFFARFEWAGDPAAAISSEVNFSRGQDSGPRCRSGNFFFFFFFFCQTGRVFPPRRRRRTRGRRGTVPRPKMVSNRFTSCTRRSGIVFPSACPAASSNDNRFRAGRAGAGRRSRWGLWSSLFRINKIAPQPRGDLNWADRDFPLWFF